MNDAPASKAHSRVNRRTVDLSAYPDLVVIYLGMRINAWTGVKTVFGFGPKIDASVKAKPEGLLRHERVIYSLFPPNVGMRHYWRSFEDLEAWTRSESNRLWRKAFLKKAYFMRGGPSTTTSRSRLVSAPSPRCSPLLAARSPHAAGWDVEVPRRDYRPWRRAT
jgi:Domain of unknown function (DUF4188)